MVELKKKNLVYLLHSYTNISITFILKKIYLIENCKLGWFCPTYVRIAPQKIFFLIQNKSNLFNTLISNCMVYIYIGEGSNYFTEVSILVSYYLYCLNMRFHKKWSGIASTYYTNICLIFSLRLT